jgi:hypothetical protein
MDRLYLPINIGCGEAGVDDSETYVDGNVFLLEISAKGNFASRV